MTTSFQIEKDENNRANQVYCRLSEQTVMAFLPEKLAAILQTVETRDFHRVETIDGLLVCNNSLDNQK